MTRGYLSPRLSTARVDLIPELLVDGAIAAWRISDRHSHTLVGSISFVGREGDTLLIGYEVANEWRGRGFASEALQSALAHVAGTGRAAHIVAETEADHVASRRVMEKAGMHLVDVDGARVRYAFDCAVRSTP